MSQRYSREYNTETSDGTESEMSPWETSYRREGRYPTQPEDLRGYPMFDSHPRERGLMQMFGLHPAPAFFAIVVDSMVSAVDVATLEISAPVLWLFASIVTAAVVFVAQKKWAGDDRDSALTKALMVAFLVALPTPFPAFLTVPSAIAGTVQMIRGRR